jgi:hypothetical protein
MLTNRFGNKIFMQPMRRLSMHSWGVQIFSLGGERGEGGAWSHTLFVFVFPLVLNVFLSCTRRVPSSHYPRCSQYHLTSIPYGLPKVQLPCIETEKVSNSFAHLFLFCYWGPKRCFYWGVPNSPKDLVMGQPIWSLPEKPKKIKIKREVWEHPWNN